MVRSIIPLAAIKKLVLSVGCERVSNDAVKELNEFIEEKAIIISKKIVDLSEHTNRMTVKKNDVKLVLKDFN